MSAADIIVPPKVDLINVVAATADTSSAAIDLGEGGVGRYVSIVCDTSAGLNAPFYVQFAAATGDLGTPAANATSGDNRAWFCEGRSDFWLDGTSRWMKVLPTETGFIRYYLSGPR